MIFYDIKEYLRFCPVRKFFLVLVFLIRDVFKKGSVRIIKFYFNRELNVFIERVQFIQNMINSFKRNQNQLKYIPFLKKKKFLNFELGFCLSNRISENGKL